jgi:transposase InsO family protein/predicted aspartyl protease
MIDTGSQKNYIRPEVAERLKLKTTKTTFSVQTPTGTSEGQAFVWYPLTNLLDMNKYVRFFVFPFHREYDFLLGHELLNTLGASLDFNKGVMTLPEKELTIMTNTSHEINTISSTVRHVSDKSLHELETEYLNDILRQYETVFDDDTTLRPSLLIKHKIRTTDDEPVFTRNYRYPHVYREKVDNEIRKMLDKGIIRPSKSPYNSPIWVVNKKPDSSGEQKIRIVIDYRKLNNKTIEDKFPMPNIDELIFQLGKSKYYSSLDLASGFHQLEMDEESIEKTAFSTENCHYEFVRMPFGLKNAPPTFQRAMNSLFVGKSNVLVYLDDIIIFSKTLEDHVKHIKEVLGIIKENNLTVQPDKSKFFKRELKFLGYWINQDGIKPDPDKVSAIANMTIPHTEKQIKSFLGLTGFYRKLIKGYADIAKPLTNCLKKSTKIDVADENYRNAFEKLRTCLMTDPILSFPCFEKQFFLTTDASGDALGAVLAQENEQGVRVAIAYASRTLNPAEQNLSTIERELLAVVWATKYFRHYLYGVRFTLETDHKPLVWLNSIKEPNAKLMRWKLQLNEFNFVINHVAGRSNKVADTLSRPFDLNINENNESPLPMISPTEVSRVLASCNDTSNVDQSGADFWSNEWDWAAGPAPSVETIEDTAPRVRKMPTTHTINVENNQIIIVNNHAKLTTETKFNSKTRFRIGIPNDSTLNAALETLTPKIRPYTAYGVHMKPSHLGNQAREEILNKFLKGLHERVEGINFKIYENLTLDIEDEDERALIVAQTHVSKTMHRGINENYEYLKKRYYWPRMKEDVNMYINQCEVCNLVKYDRRPIKVKFKETFTPERPFTDLQMDIFYWDKSPVLTLVDAFSKRLTSYKLRTTNGKEVVRKLKSYLSNNPKPYRITSDNGTEFKNSEVHNFLEIHEIEHRFTPEAHHDSLGLVNRCHGTLREVMRSIKEETKEITIKTLIKEATIIFNNSANSLTKLSPNEMTYGIETKLPHSEEELSKLKQTLHLDEYIKSLKLIHAKIKDQIEHEKTTRNERLNQTREDPDKIKLGKRGFIKNTHHRKEKNPYSKVEIIDSTNVKHGNTMKKIHLNRIKRPKRMPLVTDEGDPSVSIQEPPGQDDIDDDSDDDQHPPEDRSLSDDGPN